MDKREGLKELLGRVEAATGADRELDAGLFRALGGELPTEFMGTGIKLSWDASGKAWCHLPDGMRISFTPPELTSSIDAALALCERVLGKHWFWEIKGVIGFRCILWMLETDYDDRSPPTGHSAASAPLAILAAILTALLAHEEKRG